ncbi:uncharacterized protein METZ01_LOCUS272153 [marine metagenome]|uniref:Bacterial sugar transferase domain-containing protein n=1 Tax=marine metagenome TaxID=408172 RepID=A0A382K565_9ZZZZ
MKKSFDIFLGVLSGVILAIPMMFIACIIKLTSQGSVLFWSDRVGQNNKLFSMPKFRAMKKETPQLATHLLDDPESFYTPFGRFLRKLSLDELPQLYSILKGNMSFVGPRPALYNQDDLIELRTKKGIHKVKPGLTGWAQVNGRDEISIPEKVILDEEYLRDKSLKMDIFIIWLTLIKVIKKDSVSH